MCLGSATPAPCARTHVILLSLITDRPTSFTKGDLTYDLHVPLVARHMVGVAQRTQIRLVVEAAPLMERPALALDDVVDLLGRPATPNALALRSTHRLTACVPPDVVLVVPEAAGGGAPANATARDSPAAPLATRGVDLTGHTCRRVGGHASSSTLIEAFSTSVATSRAQWARSHSMTSRRVPVKDSPP